MRPTFTALTSGGVLCVSGPGQPGVLCCLPPVPHTPSPHPTPLQPVVPARLPPMLDEVSEAAALPLDTGEQQLFLVRSRVGELCRGVFGAAALPLQDAETPLPVRGCSHCDVFHSSFVKSGCALGSEDLGVFYDVVGIVYRKDRAVVTQKEL